MQTGKSMRWGIWSYYSDCKWILPHSLKSYAFCTLTTSEMGR